MRSCAIFSDKGCMAIAMNFIKALLTIIIVYTLAFQAKWVMICIMVDHVPEQSAFIYSVCYLVMFQNMMCTIGHDLEHV